MDLISIIGVGAFALAIDILVTEYDEEYKGDKKKKHVTRSPFLQTFLKNGNYNLKGGGLSVNGDNILSDKFMSNVVDSIVIKHGERMFDIPSYKDYDYTKITNKNDSEYTDLNREFKSLSTDVVIESYVKTKDNLFRFMKLVIEVMERSLDIYAKKREINRSDIIFAYKGGNVMRIIANEFLVELPGMASREINNYYQNYFKRSDADFTIYINPKLQNYNIIFEELTFLSYLVQFIIREEFVSNMDFYFEYDKYNDETKKNILEDFLNKINKASSLNNDENTEYFETKFVNVSHRGLKIDIDGNSLSVTSTNPKDTFIQFDDNKETVVFNISNNEKYMYLQCNSSLKFTDTVGIRYFNLVRTKLNFDATLKQKDGTEITKSYGGELIDVSIPHKTSFGIESFWKNKDKYIRKYTLTNEKESISFNTYSIEYVIEDLEDVLFRQSQFPWDDKKYMKRVNRLFYFYFLDMFAKLPSNNERIYFIISLKKMLNKVENGVIQIDKVKSLYDEMDGYDLHLKKIIIELVRLFNENKKFDQKDEFNGFVRILTENCNVINGGFKHTEQFCKVHSQIKEKKQIITNISSLAGGTRKK